MSLGVNDTRHCDDTTATDVVVVVVSIESIRGNVPSEAGTADRTHGANNVTHTSAATTTTT